MPRDVKLAANQFVVRAGTSVSHPVRAVAEGFCDSPEFYEARRPFLDELVRQRRSAHGFTAALSAAVELYDHQLDTVARVLSDPVLRYLLGDEVGLGKTIEAGLVVRQLMLDDSSAMVLIAVPATLVDQWRDEIRNKFLLGRQLGGQRLVLISHDELGSVPRLRERALVVVDEAHQLLPHLDRRPALREELLAVPGLLLLSATPMRGDPTTFRDLLNLVDPVAFPRTDIAAFRQRLLQREKEATDLEVLVARKASLRQRRSVVGDLMGTHGNDPAVVRLAERCLAETDVGGPYWAELADYVRETYRISRRVVRHRRNTGPTEDYPVAGRRAIFIPVDDPAQVVVDEFLDRYRDLVNEGGPAVSVAQYPFAVLNGLGGPRTLLHHLRRRLAVRPGGAAAVLSRERVLLESTVARLLLAETSTRTVTALDIVQERLNKGQKIVVVGTSVAGAQDFFDAAVERWPGIVGSHLERTAQRVREESVAAFLYEPGARVLVGDSSIEEGRNLQGADVLVNLDLPIDPNRLEQRIGRLDRYARRVGPAEVVVFTEPSSEWVTAHLQLLRDGIGIFNESVATLQRRLAEVVQHVVDALLAKGSEAFLFDVDELRDSLAAERIEIDLLDELESVAVSTSFDQGSAADLRAADADVGALRAAFSRLTSLQGGINLRHHEDQRGVVRFSVRPGERILGLPDDVVPAVRPLVGGEWAYERSLAVDLDGVAPFRLGNPLVDWLDQYLRTDERGRARAVVRPSRNVEEPTLWLSCDILVEFDASHLASETAAVANRLRRRGDALLPPEILRICTNALGQAPSPSCAEVLSADFDEYRDRLLSGPIWREVLEAFPAWTELCRLAGEAALEHARRSPAVTTAPVAAAHQARDEITARLAILRARSHQLPSEAEREGAYQEMRLAEYLGQALVNGIEKPVMSVIACGAVVLWPSR
ncbi:hypothetical protein G7043_39765 [Lentzea sp. NEAU-D13]|uniref:ATP-dependent helicase HepA n=2 Tax=Lentzea alba TaxID=2714351 RepID=A0A7C9RX57_9PSEU|nr:hypothetical protein [Lentzea alba]